jgi:hypothetical protein
LFRTFRLADRKRPLFRHARVQLAPEGAPERKRHEPESGTQSEVNPHVARAAKRNEVLCPVVAWSAMMHDQVARIRFSAELALTPIAAQHQFPLTSEVLPVQTGAAGAVATFHVTAAPAEQGYLPFLARVPHLAWCACLLRSFICFGLSIAKPLGTFACPPIRPASAHVIELSFGFGLGI